MKTRRPSRLRKAECSICGNEFETRHSQGKYCSAPCAKKAQRATEARWKADNKGAVRAIQRAYYHRHRDQLLERQRAYSKTPEGRAAEAAKRERQLREAPEKIFARGVVGAALRARMITKQPCKCGETKVEAHHDDYSKPLEIEWMCKACHAIEHRL